MNSRGLGFMKPKGMNSRRLGFIEPMGMKARGHLGLMFYSHQPTAFMFN